MHKKAAMQSKNKRILSRLICRADLPGATGMRATIRHAAQLNLGLAGPHVSSPVPGNAGADLKPLRVVNSGSARSRDAKGLRTAATAATTGQVMERFLRLGNVDAHKRYCFREIVHACNLYENTRSCEKLDRVRPSVKAFK